MKFNTFVARSGGVVLVLNPMAQTLQIKQSEKWNRPWRKSRKESMNLIEKEQANVNTVNVLSLLGSPAPDIAIPDPMEVLLEEAGTEIIERREALARKVVDVNQFPDQSICILEDQLKSLTTSLNRIKFYLGELDDILPG